MRFYVRLLLSLLMIAAALPAHASEEGCIVMVPDLARPQASLDYAARYLADAGYEVHIAPLPENTPASEYTLEGLANHVLAPFIEQTCQFYKPKVHFVTYGLGTLILNQYMFDHDMLNVGRVVMIEPPVYNQKMVEEVHKQHPLYQQYARQYTNKLEPRIRVKAIKYWELPVGVIGYNESLGYKYGEKNADAETEEDKKISRDLFVPGMSDDIYIKASPDLIMQNETAMKHAVYFLKNGMFEHEEE